MNSKKLAGKKILITAGPTREAIDPVRYISNRSTGLVGYALAEEFLQQGAHVFLVSGPLCINIHHPKLVVSKVNTGAEMYLACCRYFEQVDLAVFTAAVSDFKAARISPVKLSDDNMMIKLVPNIDIAKEFGKVKSPSQLSIGFLQEANATIAKAENKIEEKNFDMVVLHSIDDFHAGSDERNRITIIKNDLTHISYPLINEKKVAKDICFEMSRALSHAELAEMEEREQGYELMYS
jgi:phosphopantothenoylcysteine decarboxylase/phosphopantothenate--cysteine ligase